MAVKVDREYWIRRVKGKRGEKETRATKRAVVKNWRRLKESQAARKGGRRAVSVKAGRRVVVKVTSGARSYKELSANIDYISRRGELKLYDSQGREFLGKEREKVKEEMGFQNEFLRKGRDASKSKQTYHIIFSLAAVKEKKDLIDGVRETVEKQYPDNYFAFTLHEDTDHPHMHLVLNKMNLASGKNINLNKTALAALKTRFSLALIKRGVDVQREIFRTDKNKKPTGVFELVGHGKAPYRFLESNPESYYVTIKTHHGELSTFWGKGLEKAIIESGAQKGQEVRLKREGERKKGESANWSVEVYGQSFAIKK